MCTAKLRYTQKWSLLYFCSFLVVLGGNNGFDRNPNQQQPQGSGNVGNYFFPIILVFKIERTVQIGRLSQKDWTDFSKIRHAHRLISLKNIRLKQLQNICMYVQHTHWSRKISKSGYKIQYEKEINRVYYSILQIYKIQGAISYFK